VNSGTYQFRGGNNFTNAPIDRRRLNKRDRSDLNQSGEYGAQATAYKRVRAYNAQNKMMANRDQRTTDRTPGTGGQSAGIGLQQERYRQIGQDNQAAKANRPDMDDSMYDIYKTD